jgi:class 3 adenylate cyclase
VRWRLATVAGGKLVRLHHGVVRRELARHHGVEVDTAGDGFFATFEAPSDAILCSLAVRDAVRSIGLEVRQGIHVGECQLVAGKVGGISVVVAARTRELSRPGEILVTGTLREVVAGQPLRFSDRGSKILKGVPGRWRMYAVETGG